MRVAAATPPWRRGQHHVRHRRNLRPPRGLDPGLPFAVRLAAPWTGIGGIVTADGDRLHRRAHMGQVADGFSRDVLDQLPGNCAIGHVRYSTSGDSNPSNAQPFLFQHYRGPIAIAHNGNLVNAGVVRDELESDGAIFQTTSDTETILHLAARTKAPDVVDALVEALRGVEGAYSMAALVPDG